MNNIHCVKYHYSLTENLSQATNNYAFIEFSKDFKYMYIYNRKLKEEDKYVL